MGVFRRHRWLYCLVPVLGAVAVWWLLTAFFLQPARIYPPPDAVARDLVRIFSNQGPMGPPLEHAVATLFRLFVSWGCAFVLGTLFGVLAGRFRWFFDFSRSLVWVVMAIPSVVWVFIFLIIFGISNIVPIAALVLLLGAPVFIGSAEGVRAVPAELIEMSNSYKISRWSRLVDVYLPSITPYLVSNARVSFAFGIKIVIIAEVVGLPSGVGILVQYWSDSLFMAPVVAWGLLLMALGLVVDRFFFAPMERWIRREPGASFRPRGLQ